nr:uncharacterized protein C16orf46 homolog [Manis javanica]XP_036849641.1 uncharacterized protein C16orf46 homolog [Manis javanica]
MDLCQKNETELENSENNEIQSTEETELTYTCPDERSEKNHVFCLLNISDITREQDEEAHEFAIRTGWDEAVRGWGRTSPTACIWPTKKFKKTWVGESASRCLLCFSLSQRSPQARPQLEAGKLELGALAEVGPEKEQDGPSQAQAIRQGPLTTSREISKICFPTSSQVEKKSLQIKEFIWCTEDWATPETDRGKDPSTGADRGPSISDSWISKALLNLPPLKPSPQNTLDILGKKSKNIFLQPEEKVLSMEKGGSVACANGLKTVEGKDEKRLVGLAKPLKIHAVPPFPTKTLAADPQLCCLPWAPLPGRNLGGRPSHSNVRYLAALQLLQKREVQSYRAKFKDRLPRPPMNIRKREAKQENGPHTLDTKVFPKPLLPPLTVSRVIPGPRHRLL